MKMLSSGTRSSLMRECAMRCSARRVVLVVIVIIALRLLWLSLFSTSSSSRRANVGDMSEDNGVLSGLFGSKSDVDIPQNARGLGLEAREGSFYLDGRKIRIISGSFHYFRTLPEQWKDRLQRMKAAYVNTVMTYIPWNLHEQRRGEYNFTAGGWDIVRFIKLVQEMELHLIVRPGPYICAEWEFGGFPSWLLHDPNMVTRTSSYAPYLNHVKQYFNQLFPLLAQFTHQRGGPIIAFQVENEFGSSTTSPDHIYLRFIASLFRTHGIKEPLFTSDGARQLPNGTLPELLATVNFKEEPSVRLNKLQKFQPGKPLMVTEFWPGWFDHWGEQHHTMHVDVFKRTVGEVLENGASINLYMFVGGTNFGFWNGANFKEGVVLPTVTSYDYDTIISECGDVHPHKFRAFRALLKKHGFLTATKRLPVPLGPPKRAYGLVKVDQVMALDSILKLAGETLTLQEPVFMEFLSVNGNGGQGYGYIVYRGHVHGNAITVRGALHDWAQVLVNGVLVETIDGRKDAIINRRVSFASQDSDTSSLEILVENMGRVNYAYHNMSNLRKGFQGEVVDDGEKVKSWEHIPLEFDSHLIEAIRLSNEWKRFANDSTATKLYRGSFTVSEDPVDTFLDMSSWGKGVAIVNGFVLGRYWNVGPQQTLYVPWPLLKKGQNEVIVFELQKVASAFKFIDKPILNAS